MVIVCGGGKWSYIFDDIQSLLVWIMNFLESNGGLWWKWQTFLLSDMFATLFIMKINENFLKTFLKEIDKKIPSILYKKTSNWQNERKRGKEITVTNFLTILYMNYYYLLKSNFPLIWSWEMKSNYFPPTFEFWNWGSAWNRLQKWSSNP